MWTNISVILILLFILWVVTYKLWHEGFLWLIGVVVCLHAIPWHSTSSVGTEHGSTAHIRDTALRAHHWRAHHPGLFLFKIAVTTYWALNGSTPVYLSSYFTRVTDVPSRQRLRSASSNQLAVPPFNLSTVDKQAFPVSGTNFWNSLPSHVASAPAPSLTIFRQHLKTFLFHLSYPDVIFWFVSCFIVDLAIILLFRPH